MVGPTIAEGLFRSIETGGADYLRSLVNSTPPTFETEHLDFKGGAENGKPLDDSKLRRIWSEALSGFGTTSGGVLVWGIDARKTGDPPVDAACGLNLVENPAALRSRLQEVHNQSTDPPVPGVRYCHFHDVGDSGPGFVVCLIPESNFRPHRSEHAGKRWFMRMGDSFQDVPPSVLKSLFFPQRRSYVTLNLSRVPARDHELAFQVSLLNHGPASFDQPVFSFRDLPGMSFRNLMPWLSLGNTSRPTRFASEQPLHPGETIECGKFEFETHRMPRSIPFRFRLFGHDREPVCYVIEYDVSRASTYVLKPEFDEEL